MLQGLLGAGGERVSPVCPGVLVWHDSGGMPRQRWSGVVSVAAQRALAGLPSAGQDAAAPPSPEVLAVVRHGAAEAVSRLPLRPG